MRLIAALIVMLAAGPAVAQDADEGGHAFRPVVESLIAEVIVPAHAAFGAAAASEVDTVAALCAGPSAGRLASAREGFLSLADAFSRIEMFRFGPAREDNRIERLFFWPDRRGRGLQQVQGVLADEDESAASPDTLYAKSVALQGLPALEFVLFGTGSDALADEAGFRCRYAESIARVVAGIAAALEAEWRGPFAALVAEAGPDSPAYRSHGEAFQDIIQAAAEQLEIINLYKIGPVLGDTPEAARPRRAPFWRSGATLPTILANLEGVGALLTDDVAALLGEDGELVPSAHFELRQAAGLLTPVADHPSGFEQAARSPDGQRRMVAARYPIDGAHAILAERVPTALGLIAGFNAMDGD